MANESTFNQASAQSATGDIEGSCGASEVTNTVEKIKKRSSVAVMDLSGLRAD